MASVAAIFDLDGTLVTFKFDVKGTREAIIDELSKRKFDTSVLNLTTPTQTMINIAKAQVESGKVSVDVEEVLEAIYLILDKSELETSEKSDLIPGVRETLDYLRSRQVRLGVLTNSGRLATTKMLERAGIQGFFEFVLCRDDVTAMKPSPDGLAKAVALLGLPRDSVYYIGDSKYDIMAARGAGVWMVAVASGNYTAEKLKEEGANYVVSNLEELPGVLGV